MNRRNFLLGLTALGLAATIHEERDRFPDDEIGPSIGGEPSHNDVTSDDIEIMKWRYFSWEDEHVDDDYGGTARLTLKNVGDQSWDFRVRFTPIHKNGNPINTKGEKLKIRPLEYEEFERIFHEDSARFVDTLGVEIQVSDRKWFNGWKTIHEVTYEF